MSMQHYKPSESIAAAVLAGGKNKRMAGLNKSFVKIKDTTIIDRTVDLLKTIFSEIIIVTNSPQDYVVYEGECSIVTDKIKDIGPLGGIFTALSQTSKPSVFFVACDMPFLHNELILHQLTCFKERDCDALVPRIGVLVEPLHAIYKKDLANNIQRFVKENMDYSIKTFLETIAVCYWDLEDNSFHRNIFRNLNTIDDVNEINDRLCG